MQTDDLLLIVGISVGGYYIGRELGYWGEKKDDGGNGGNGGGGDGLPPTPDPGPLPAPPIPIPGPDVIIPEPIKGWIEDVGSWLHGAIYGGDREYFLRAYKSNYTQKQYQFFYAATWRNMEIAAATKSRMEQLRTWLVDAGYLPAAVLPNPPIPPTPPPAGGDKFVFVQASVPTLFVVAGQDCIVYATWRNESRDLTTQRLRLRVKHNNWHWSDTFEASAHPGQMITVALRWTTKASYSHGDRLDVEVWHDRGFRIGQNWEKVWERDDAMQIVSQPVDIPPWMQ